ncbi:hypothetical protein EDB89DRAFT_1908595 [Lactarius sanguifluus]|nr:hypothetical protein EDB89DRAFT_1908595 [Lactarius sanguifluus]
MRQRAGVGENPEQCRSRVQGIRVKIRGQDKKDGDPKECVGDRESDKAESDDEEEESEDGGEEVVNNSDASILVDYSGILVNFFAFGERGGVNLSERGVGFRGVTVCLDALIEEASLGGGVARRLSSTLETMRVSKRDKTGMDSPLAQQLVTLPEEFGHSKIARTQKISQRCLVDAFDSKGLRAADWGLGPMVRGTWVQEIYEVGRWVYLWMPKPQKRVMRSGGVSSFFSSPLPTTTMSLYTGFGNGFDGGSMGDQGSQAPDVQNQWQFNSMGNCSRGQTECFRLTSRTDVILGIVAGASEAALERNAFYVGLKTMASNRATEIEALKGTIDQKTQEIVGRDKEIDILKARCETLEGTIDKFARDYHTLKGAGGDEGQITFLSDLGPMPTPWKRNENTEVTIWIKREFALATAKAKAQKGESSGDPSDATKTKGRAGRPSKKVEETEGHKFIYLQRRDGTMISVETLRKMSEKARSVWDFLLEKKMATPQFCKLGWSARDLYTRAMLTDPLFDFLLLCDDATWKLREWSIQNYPGWASNRGLRPKNTDQNADKNEDVLDDPALVRMQSSDGTDDFNSGIEPADHVSENDNHGIEETTVPQPGDHPKENPGPSTRSPRGPVVPEENPGPSTQSPSRGPVQSVIANPFAPTASSSSSGTHAGVTTTNPTIAPTSSAPAQTSEDAATTTQTHAVTNNILGGASPASTVATAETHTGSDDPSRPTGTTPPGGSDPTTTTNGAIPPHRRIKFTLRSQANTTVAQGNQDPVAPPVPSEPTQTTTTGPSDSQTPVPVHPITAPTDAPIPNLRLERAMANVEKKRKAEGKTTAATSKKQKTATALAEPTGTITVKSWNEKQPGGQGLAADFDAYFKGLSDTDKEHALTQPNGTLPHTQQLKTEMRVAQAAVRKAKTAKKHGEVPSAN